MKRVVEFRKLDDFIFPLIENICKPRGLAHGDVSSLFVATCEGCGAHLDGHSLAMQASAIMMGHVPSGCSRCGHDRLVTKVSSLSFQEKWRLKRDQFFSTLATSQRAKSNRNEISKLQARYSFWRLVGIGLLLNFIIWTVVMLYLGGEAGTGKLEDGRYYLHSRTGYIEVSPQIFRYSKVHTYIVFGSGPICLLAIFIANRARRRVRELTGV